MTAKHTPGPWYQRTSSGEQGLIIREETGETIAVVYDLQNNHVIAAAPDLLAALEGIVDEYAGISDKWVIDARAAIAKATGQ